MRSSTRRFASVTIPLAELKAIRRAHGGSVDDVALAACTSGLRRLLLERGEQPPKQGVRAMVPTNVRDASGRRELGNRISSLFVDLPVAEPVAKALGLVIPELAGRLNGYAVRVPMPTGSLVDLTVETERPTSRDEVNSAFEQAADSGALAGVLAYTEDPIVSSDIVKSSYSSIFDAGLTSGVDGTQVKVVAWYDNEWGYSSRLVELAERVIVPVAA
jgi:glyceraldehyde-3-phosphate dehydrogenase/erythrose-4-phosphate dehydrogenase